MALPRIVMWEPAEPGIRAAGLARLGPEGDGYRADGSVTAVAERPGRFPCGEPWSMRFTIRLGADFRTRSIDVESITAAGCARLVLEGDGDGRWTADGSPAPAIDGCLDVDLGSTPFTNTLPIRRLGLRVGEAREVRVAWIGAPGLELRAVALRYTRLPPQGGADAYQYESLASGFSTTMTVDDEGLVIDYERVSRRIASR